MWALALTLVAALPPLDVVPRPDGEVKAPLAQVVLHAGAVTITPAATKGFEVKRGMQLGGSDTVTVGVGAWVVLNLLGNGQVVRLDDDLQLRVDQLAALKAQKQKASLEDQLNRLVTVKEQDAATRLIGWNAGQSGANVPQTVKTTGGGGPEKKPRDESLDEGGGTQTKTAPKAPAPPPKPTETKEKEETKKTPPPPPPGNTAPMAPMPQPDPMPLAADAALEACVVKSVQALGPEVLASLGESIVVRVKLRDGTTVVQLPNGLPTPACAVSWFYGKPGLGAAWTDVRVKLK
jgi:predicted transcriptional regulator